MRARLVWSLFLPALAGGWALSAQAPASTTQAFDVTEATIAQIHAAMRGGRLTCRALVTAYQARIDAHDKRGAALNAYTRWPDQQRSTG